MPKSQGVKMTTLLFFGKFFSLAFGKAHNAYKLKINNELGGIFMLSPSLENYLIVIYEATKRGEEVTCADVAKYVNIPLKKVIPSIQRIHYQKYICYTAYQPIKMTEKGEQLAEFLLSRETLLDEFIKILQLTENIEEEKETMGQYFTIETLERMEKFVLFVNQHPEILNRYKSFLKKPLKTRILEQLPEDER